VTISKGAEWGTAATLSADSPVVSSDAEVRTILDAARRAGNPLPVVGLVGGDLWQAMGEPAGGAERLRSERARQYSCDLGVVAFEGESHIFVAHMLARSRWWSGRVVAAMNSEFMGPWLVAPRAHPNDGLLDLVDASVPRGQQWQARRRLGTGRHLPHPGIKVRRTSGEQFEFDRPVLIRVDGTTVGKTRSLTVEIEPDAFEFVV
jgi:diacylglycerol kinase family enzyme